MQMQLGIDSQIPDGLLAANALLGENSRLGVPTSTHTLHRGLEFAISSTVLGLEFQCYESASDPVVAPNSVLAQIQRVYQSGCVGQALRSNAGSLLLDAAGVALTASPLGAEAKIVGAIALGAGSTVVGAVEANTTSTKGVLATAGAFANIFGIQTAPLALAEDFARFSSGAGKLLTGVGIGADLASVGIDIKGCLGKQQ